MGRLRGLYHGEGRRFLFGEVPVGALLLQGVEECPVVTGEVYEELLYCGNKEAYSAEMAHVGEDMDGIDALKGSIYGERRCEDGGNTVEDILIEVILAEEFSHVPSVSYTHLRAH